MEILTLTMNPAVDVSLETQHIVSEKKVRCSKPVYDPGGGGVNVARVINELQGQVVAVYLSGGQTGQLMETLLDKKGIEQQPIPIAGRVRENIAILEKTSGELYRFVMPGPEIGRDEQQQCLNVLTQYNSPDYLVISGSLPTGVSADFLVNVIAEMKESQAKILLDTEAVTMKAVLEKEKVFLIKPNMHELQQLTEENIQNERQQENAAKKIVDQGKAEVVVVSLGAGGALIVTKDVNKRLRSPSVPVKSKVGAGDSMLGAVVLGLSRGITIIEAAKYGISAGSAAVMTPGTKLCRSQDVEELYEQIK